MTRAVDIDSLISGHEILLTLGRVNVSHRMEDCDRESGDLRGSPVNIESLVDRFGGGDISLYEVNLALYYERLRGFAQIKQANGLWVFSSQEKVLHNPSSHKAGTSNHNISSSLLRQ